MYTLTTRSSWGRQPPTGGTGRSNIASLGKLLWLGYWFVPNLASSAHFSRQLALSQAPFCCLRRLSDRGKGFSPHLCHRLTYCSMFLILSYGADLFSPTKGLYNKMEVPWRPVQRWVTHYFQSTPLPILAAESCLPPLIVLLPRQRRMAALRLIFSPMSINPASARHCRSFPSLLKTRAPNSYRALCARLASNVMPLNWKTPLSSPPVRSHPPVDVLAHFIHSLHQGPFVCPADQFYSPPGPPGTA